MRRRAMREAQYKTFLPALALRRLNSRHYRCDCKYETGIRRVPDAGNSLSNITLRQIVAERGPDHVVHGLRRNAGPARVIVAGPPLSGEVGVLNSPAETAFRSLGNLIPEPKRSLQDEAGISRAGAASRRSQLVRRRRLTAAARVVGEYRAVSTDPGCFDRSGRGC